MKPKDKVWMIVQALLDRRNSDDEIISYSGNELTVDDLDRFYKPAEKIIDKARSKPEEEPRGKSLIEECRSWLDYYEWPDR